MAVRAWTVLDPRDLVNKTNTAEVLLDSIISSQGSL